MRRSSAMPGVVRVSVPLLALWTMLSSCGADFVDAAPPQIERRTRELKLQPKNEPLVYLIILDLQVPDLTICQSNQTTLTTLVRRTMQGLSKDAIELPLVDLSPNCQQSNWRRFDATAFASAVAQLPRAPGATVRPVVFYFNNVDLYLPFALVNDLTEVRNQPTKPVLWAAAPTSVTESKVFEASFEWSYSSDPNLESWLTKLAQRTLPFVSRPMLPNETAPIFEDGGAGVHEFKICSGADAIIPKNFVLKAAMKMNAADPPAFTLRASALVAAPRSTYTGDDIRIELEVCRANCDRFVESKGSAARWNELSTCFLSQR